MPARPDLSAYGGVALIRVPPDEGCQPRAQIESHVLWRGLFRSRVSDSPPRFALCAAQVSSRLIIAPMSAARDDGSPVISTIGSSRSSYSRRSARLMMACISYMQVMYV